MNRVLACAAFAAAAATPAFAGSSFIRGDANMDGSIDISDALTILGYMFLGDPRVLPNRDAADVDDNGSLEITDPLFDLGFLFLGTAHPPPPFPMSGFDVSPDPFPDGDFADAAIDRYCTIGREPDGLCGMVFELELTPFLDHPEISIPEYGIAAIGTRTGDAISATLIAPGGEALALEIVLSDGGFTGTLVGSGFDETVEGTEGACKGDGAGEPTCVLPVPAAMVPFVTAGQQWHSVSESGVVHRGLDFGFSRPGPAAGMVLRETVAPCSGSVREIRRHQLGTGRWMYSVTIRYGPARKVLLGFEPDSPEEKMVDLQGQELAVVLGQAVAAGDLVGRLVVANLPAPDPTAYVPHLHWGMYATSSEVDDACPATFLGSAAASTLKSLYGSLPGPTPGSHLLPVCME